MLDHNSINIYLLGSNKVLQFYNFRHSLNHHWNTSFLKEIKKQLFNNQLTMLMLINIFKLVGSSFTSISTIRIQQVWIFKYLYYMKNKPSKWRFLCHCVPNRDENASRSKSFWLAVKRFLAISLDSTWGKMIWIRF